MLIVEVSRKNELFEYHSIMKKKDLYILMNYIIYKKYEKIEHTKINLILYHMDSYFYIAFT